jgi:ABC-type branched-subunit amino acid transport system ATPase component
VPLLETDRLCRSFGGLTALSDVCLSVGEGEIVGLAGQNGAGKTTLINVISGAMPPSSGTIVFGDQPIHGLQAHAIARRGIARTFQLTRCFSELTAEENVMVGGLFGFEHSGDVDRARSRAAEIIAGLGLDDVRHRHPLELTLANRKRLEIARALAAGPRLILLDEVAAGLTPSETDELVDQLQTVLAGAMSVIIIEHVLEVVVRLAARMYVLDQGQVIAEGAPLEVLRDDVVVDRFIGAGR